MMCRKRLNRVAGTLEAITIRPIGSELLTPSSMTSLRQFRFMPCTAQLPKREELDEWQERSEKTLRKLKPKIRSLERQTHESNDYQACLTRLTVVNDARLTSGDREDEETIRQEMYASNRALEKARMERRQSALTWSSARPATSDGEEEDEDQDDVSVQQGSETQETAVKQSRFGEKIMARLRHRE